MNMSIHIEEKYASLGGEDGFLGSPTGPETSCADGVGRKRSYQGGIIYWHPDTGAYEVHGAILSRYRDWDQAKGVLGYPTTDETDSPNGGRYNRFQHGLIVWTPESGAQGIHENGLNIGSPLDFRHIHNTHYGNLTDFYVNMCDWTGIDLRRNSRVDSDVRRYTGWHVRDFSSGERLNGYLISRLERFVLTVARVLVMQWHLRDLENHRDVRLWMINKYFRPNANFKRNSVLKWRNGRVRVEWHYNDWCSEFASYIYKCAGMPLKLGKRQTFVAKNIVHYQKLGWCVTRFSYFDDIFRSANQWLSMSAVAKTDAEANSLYVPTTGDFLRTNHHSMLILGTSYDEAPSTSVRNLRLHIIEGNGGSGAPEGSEKRVRLNSRLALDDHLVGVGRMNLMT